MRGDEAVVTRLTLHVVAVEGCCAACDLVAAADGVHVMAVEPVEGCSCDTCDVVAAAQRAVVWNRGMAEMHRRLSRKRSAA